MIFNTDEGLLAKDLLDEIKSYATSELNHKVSDTESNNNRIVKKESHTRMPLRKVSSKNYESQKNI